MFGFEKILEEMSFVEKKMMLEERVSLVRYCQRIGHTV